WGGLEGMIFTGLAAVIALSPMPLGSNRPLAWDVMGLCVALLLGASLALSRDKGIGFRSYLAAPAALFVIVVCFVIVQASPLTPAAWHNPIWDQASEALGRDVRGAIAVDRRAALTYLFRLLSYAGIFYLSALLCRDASRARTAIKLVTWSGSV